MSLPVFAPAWWTWRLSAHSRAASLLVCWALVLGSPALGPLALPLFGLRFLASSGQTVFNAALGRTQPLAPRPRLDWLLFALTFVLACAAAQIGNVTGEQHSPLLLAVVALPYSAIQLRTCLRCYRASDEAATVGRRLAPPATFPVAQQRAA
jgi:hypothetical protein